MASLERASNKPTADTETSVPALIDFQNISVMRGGKLALNNLTLRISQNEHVAVLGPNGCGKSTLIKTITRECYPLYSPDSKITIMGKELWNVFELRLFLGIVTNDLMANCRTGTTGRDIVLSGFFSSLGIFSNHHLQPDQLKRADAALAEVGALHLADRPVEQMSSGEAQRILIARALVHNPKALLFDEPSNSLDLRIQHELRDTMRKLAQSGVGIVLVTHQTADIIPEIERVVLMRDGRIVGDGRKEDRDGYCHVW
jgi:iron complex transport system ATP-binding protein